MSWKVLTSSGFAASHQRPRLRAAGVAIAFKLIESAQTRWQAVNAPRLVAPVRAEPTQRVTHLTYEVRER